MAPKEQPISELGALVQHGNGWRVEVKINRRTQYGPQRATRSEAESDRARARQSTSRNEYEECLQKMRAAVKKEKPVKEEPVHGSPDNPAPQASAASSSALTDASVSAVVVETPSPATGADAKRRKKQATHEPAESDLPQDVEIATALPDFPTALPDATPQVASGTSGEAAMQGSASVGGASAGNEAMEDPADALPEMQHDVEYFEMQDGP